VVAHKHILPNQLKVFGKLSEYKPSFILTDQEKKALRAEKKKKKKAPR